MARKGLTLKQQRFVDEYVVCGNASEAARRAGYSAKTAGVCGQENLKKPIIQEAIKSALDAIESQKTASPEEVHQFITAVMRGEIEEDVVVVEGAGDGSSKARLVTKGASIKDRLDAARFFGNLYARAKRDRLEESKLEAEIKEKEQGALPDTVAFTFGRERDGE